MQTKPTPKPMLIIILLCLISSAGRFVIDSYLPSLPSIQYELTLSDALTQMTLTIYLLGFGASQLIYGPLSDRFGRRKILIIGMVIFLIGNIICATAQTGTQLLTSRLIAGIGAGACGVLNRVIASDYFEGHEFAKAWSYTTTALVLTLIFAPIIGAYIQDWEGWNGNFTACAVFIAGVLIVTFIFLPETNAQLNSFGVKKVLCHYGDALCSYHFMSPTLSYMLIFAGLIAYFQISPLLLIDSFHWTPVQYGWSNLLIAGSYLLGGRIVHTWVHKLGLRKMLVIGLCISFIGGVLVMSSVFFMRNSGIIIVIFSSLFVLGARMVIPNASAIAMSHSPVSKGCSSALMGAIQMLGAVLLGGLIAQFSIKTALPLAIFFMSISGVALLLNGAEKINSAH